MAKLNVEKRTYQCPNTPVEVGGEGKLVDFTVDLGNLLFCHGSLALIPSGAQIARKPLVLSLLGGIVLVLALESAPLIKVVGDIKAAERVRSVFVVDEEGVILFLAVDQVAVEKIVVAEDDGRVEFEQMVFEKNQLLVQRLHVEVLGEDLLNGGLAV